MGPAFKKRAGFEKAGKGTVMVRAKNFFNFWVSKDLRFLNSFSRVKSMFTLGEISGASKGPSWRSGAQV